MSKGTILIVDNNRNFLETRSEFLTQNGYRVCLASCPAEALALFQQEPVDLGVFDLRLQNDDDPKDFSGVLLARRVAPYIPAIILTEHPNVPAVRLALGLDHAGKSVAVEFIAKTEGPEALLQAVEETLGRYGAAEL
jgi:DNA-binding NtrC family response regulator